MNPSYPVWLNNLIKVALAAVPIILAVWDPNKAFNSTTADAIIVGAGVAAAAMVHVIELITGAFNIRTAVNARGAGVLVQPDKTLAPN